MKKIFAFLMAAVLLCGVLTGCSLPTFSELMGNEETQAETTFDCEKKLDELLRIIDHYYVDDYDEKVMGDYLAQAAVAATGDKWSYYISADEYAEYLENSNNEYVGIGVTVQHVNEEDEGITVLVMNVDDGAAVICL